MDGGRPKQFPTKANNYHTTDRRPFGLLIGMSTISAVKILRDLSPQQLEQRLAEIYAEAKAIRTLLRATRHLATNRNALRGGAA